MKRELNDEKVHILLHGGFNTSFHCKKDAPKKPRNPQQLPSFFVPFDFSSLEEGGGEGGGPFIFVIT